MKSLFEPIKPFTYPQKGAYGRINYGYRHRNINKEKRKALRSIRRLGFDNSECWELSTTIMCWFSDNVGGYFRECGSADDWSMYDLDGVYWEDNPTKDYSGFIEAGKARVQDYKEHLEEWCATSNRYSEFIEFVIPRLIYFTQHHQCYPGDLHSREDWTEILKVMVEDLVKCDTKLFIKYFFNLWD